jgi:hypothetical protein
MSDSVTKYFELVDEGKININSPSVRVGYDREEIAKALAELVAKHTDMDFERIYELAKDRLTTRKQ